MTDDNTVLCYIFSYILNFLKTVSYHLSIHTFIHLMLIGYNTVYQILDKKLYTVYELYICITFHPYLYLIFSIICSNNES